MKRTTKIFRRRMQAYSMILLGVGIFIAASLPGDISMAIAAMILGCVSGALTWEWF